MVKDLWKKFKDILLGFRIIELLYNYFFIELNYL